MYRSLLPLLLLCSCQKAPPKEDSTSSSSPTDESPAPHDSTSTDSPPPSDDSAQAQDDSAPPALAELEFVTPAEDAKISGGSLVVVRQLNPAVAPADIQSATLELSTDSLTWTSVAEFGQGTSPIGASPDEWVAILPTQGLPSGDVELRATFITLAGRSTPPVRRLRLNQPPVAMASGQVRDYEITWDASASTDPDGTITTYEWDFGDGTKGTGVNPTHTYPYLPGTYTVTLLVTDNTGLTAMTAVEVVVTAQEQVYIQSAVTCVCT
ncbi:MAG TPA: PKD domain-containing protein, partial [Myxococcota bacterium]|nr:PKD domain-containing protein [Myxococcota bacterium]